MKLTSFTGAMKFWLTLGGATLAATISTLPMGVESTLSCPFVESTRFSELICPIGRYSVMLLITSWNVVSLELEQVSDHWCSHNINYSTYLRIGGRWDENSKMGALAWDLTGRNKVDHPIYHIRQAGVVDRSEFCLQVDV